MEIYILRHGEAQERRNDLAESDRQLTPKGMRDVQRVSRLARESKVRPDIVLTSPYLRSMESAQIAVGILDPKPALETTDDLLPHVRPEQLWNLVRSRSGDREILLAGHEPQLSHFILFLLGCPSLRLDLKKGALVRIRMDELRAQPRGEFKWMITPAIARAAHRRLG